MALAPELSAAAATGEAVPEDDDWPFGAGAGGGEGDGPDEPPAHRGKLLIGLLVLLALGVAAVGLVILIAPSVNAVGGCGGG